MSKYLCVCGQGFRKKKEADYRIKLHQPNEEHWPHQIVKRNWKATFLIWLCEYPWAKTFRILGIYILYIVITKHFNIRFDMAESILIGLSIGFMG